MTAFADIAELVRAPAALTVPGDSLAGAAAAGWPAGPRTAVLPVASACLYWAGMALNDWADRDLDADERPERPIPSGRVSPDLALGVAGGLSAAGVALAAVGGGPRAAALATVLTGAVWAYDLSAKQGPFSTATMASTRGLDVLLGAAAGGRDGLRRAALPAAVLTAHTAAVTALSRGEVHGTTHAVARGALATTAAVTSAVPALAAWTARTGPGGALARTGSCLGALAGAAVYGRSVGGAQQRVVADPGAGPARAATVAGIHGMVPLQGGLLAAVGAAPVAGALAGATWAARSVLRRGSPT
ncbi:UbiA family prenyltransferase [Phycicoccus sp. BSK3Z-2]|uniref:UbiA family prenyltransferase n=1 Tax=Phycicoccus avicenniae TaxID=2828860 RepID=A0A941D8V8_9MICO|nr:UbiA family prenyltransferase [Phycicoccus avicenniae]MBR7742017.1 UbiA family prenyltransferase [Phycicoccus avicenniae]